MRVRSFWIVALSAVVLLLGCRSDEQAIAEHLKRGEEYSEGEEVRRGGDRVQERAPDRPEPRGRPLRARQVATSSSARRRRGSGSCARPSGSIRRTTTPRSSSRRSAIYAGELEEALKRADAVLAENPKNEKAWLVKGQAHEALKQPAEALDRLPEGGRGGAGERGGAARARELPPPQRRPHHGGPAIRGRRQERADDADAARARVVLRRRPRARRRRRGRLSQGARAGQARRGRDRPTRCSGTSISRATASTTAWRCSRRASRRPRIRST